tara:strand:+ start:2138 stop:4171 length:2034 start_codon:yes stop_codon:yes gene_type:complete
MAKLSDIEFQSIVRNEIEQALGYYDTEFSQDRIEAMNYYLGEQFGNEQVDRSQVVSTEVSDTIEQIMPSMMRIYTQSDEYVRFTPRGPEDVKRAEHASDYVNWIINTDNAGFSIMHNWFKDALMLKLGVVKFYLDETADVSTEEYEGLSGEELVLLLNDEEVEVVEQEDRVVGEDIISPDGTIIPAPVIFDIKLKRTNIENRIQIDNIPPEEFLINKRAKSLKDASFVCHRTTMTVSDLVEMGYDQDEVEEYAGYTDIETSEERQVRFQDLESNSEFDTMDASMKEVLVTESYIKVDYDGDGIAEYRRVLTIGDGYKILDNEETDIMPFAILSPILMPHRAIGRSVAELVMDVQLIKSTLMRQLLDNIYNTNNSRTIAVEGQVNLDDLLTNRPGGVVRTRAPGMVQALPVADVSSAVFPALSYMDSVKEQRTGLSRQSMGLDADALQSTTAVAVSAMQSAAQGKIEMIARVFAETGVKDLFRGLLHLVTKYQSKPQMIRLNNEFVQMDPREWSNMYDMQINVGLGTGQAAEQVGKLLNIAAKQEQIMQTMGPNNPMVSLTEYRNTLVKVAELSGFKNPTEFFKNPADAPPQPPKQPPVDPRIAMEQQKMQSDVQLAQQKALNDLELQREKIQLEMQFKREQMAADLELRQQELRFEQELRMQQIAAGINTSTNLPRV